MSVGGKEKYSKDGPFNDPLIRCDRCQELIETTLIKRFGSCPQCGNSRVTNVKVMSEKEMKWAKAQGIDPLFLSLFREESK